jgi:hypothetical protein
MLGVPGGHNHRDAEPAKPSAVVRCLADTGFIVECHAPRVYGAKMMLWVHSSLSSRLSS